MAGCNCWVAVASAEHVRHGRRGGFMQVCHGKAGPLRRIHPGDRVVYYSPTISFGGKDRLQAFTALGTVLPGDSYVSVRESPSLDGSRAISSNVEHGSQAGVRDIPGLAVASHAGALRIASGDDAHMNLQVPIGERHFVAAIEVRPRWF